MEQPNPPVERRRNKRTGVFLKSESEAAGRAAQCVVRSLSSTGASLVIQGAAALGDRVTLSLRGIGDVPGRVIWVGDKRVGVEFDTPIDPAAALGGPQGQAVPTYEHIYDYKDYKRPGFGQQRMAPKDKW